MRIVNRPKKLPVIETSRLVLRDIRVTDISDDYIAWLNNPEVNKYLEIRFSPQTFASTKSFIESKLRDTVNSAHFGIYDQNGQRLVGTVTCPTINGHHRFANLSFVIGHPDAPGKGYASEAVHAILYWLFKIRGVEKVGAGYYDGHDGSAKVLERNGFSIEGRRVAELIDFRGRRVDHVLVGLLAGDFQPDSAKLGNLPPDIEEGN